jgi:hypothetical protein
MPVGSGQNEDWTEAQKVITFTRLVAMLPSNTTIGNLTYY